VYPLAPAQTAAKPIIRGVMGFGAHRLESKWPGELYARLDPFYGLVLADCKGKGSM
jgi:hypothetical protein